MKKIKIRLTVAKDCEDYLSAILRFVKTIKGYKDVPGKKYHFLFPKNKSISMCAVFNNIQEVKTKENEDNRMTGMYS